MTTQQDAQLGYKKETVYKTAVVVDSFVEPTAEDIQYTPTFVQGQGMRVGQRVAYADRRATVKKDVGGSFTVEALTKGHGKLFEAALGGTGTSTLISGSAYQQLFVPTTTDYLSSYTIQKGIPPLGGGATLPMTFPGMVCSGFEFGQDNAGIPTIKFNWMGTDIDTATGLATASYPASSVIYSFVDASLTLGGTVTMPTTTALATGGTAAIDVRDFSLTFDNTLDSNGWNIGSTGVRTRKPAVGLRAITGSLTAEFDTATLRDAFITQADLPLTFTLQKTTNPISGAVYPAIQFTLPNIRLEGEIPNMNSGDVVTQSIDFTGLDNRIAASPLYVAIVTAETAI